MGEGERERAKKDTSNYVHPNSSTIIANKKKVREKKNSEKEENVSLIERKTKKKHEEKERIPQRLSFNGYLPFLFLFQFRFFSSSLDHLASIFFPFEIISHCLNLKEK